MDIDRAKDELTEYYFRQLEAGFPLGSMVKIRNMVNVLAKAGEIEPATLMLEIRRAALYKLSMKRRLSHRRKQ